MYKADIRLSFSASLLVLAVGVAGQSAFAEDYYWDAWPTGSASWKTPSVTDGTGIWKNSSNDTPWSATRHASGSLPWDPNRRAVFGEGVSRPVGEVITAAEVNLQSATAAAGLRFAENPEGYHVEYTISGLSKLTLSAPVQADYRAVITTEVGVANGGSFVKNGAGMLTLAGASTYTNPTAINQGTLLLNGSLGNTAVTVNAAATLGGTGVIGDSTSPGASLTVAGTVSPGTAQSIGTLTLNGTQTWNAGSRYEMTVGGGAPTTLQLAGSANAASDLLIAKGIEQMPLLTIELLGDVPVTSPPAMFRWVLAAVEGGLPQGFSTSGITLINSTDTKAQHLSLYTESANGFGYIGVAYQAVPEATTMVLGLMALTPLLLHRRKRPGVAGV